VDDGQRSDAELALKARDGDRTAYEQLVKQYKNRIYRFIRRHVGTDEDAYDVVQDTFISAWLALHRFDQKKTFSTWLHAIALNKCRDLGRRQAVRRRLSYLVAFFDKAQRSAAQEDNTGERLEREEQLELLDKAITKLPPAWKEPLLLTVVSGMSQEQAASQLGITTKAVEMRIRRARKRLAITIADSQKGG